jgi:hypothetical protein
MVTIFIDNLSILKKIKKYGMKNYENVIIFICLFQFFSFKIRNFFLKFHALLLFFLLIFFLPKIKTFFRVLVMILEVWYRPQLKLRYRNRW